MTKAIAVSFVALLQTYFMILEMFLWTKPAGRRAFGFTKEFAESTKALAANQGLYNGFLAAGFVWALVHPNGEIGNQIAIFFCACMIVAGVFGAATASRKILLVQALPAAIVLAIVLFGSSPSAN